MSRWGKNIVVPLDSLLKEKENNNRPTVARSVGTVGKWGKMGFTSTRTYSLAALPAAVAAAAAAAVAAASPAQSPASALEDDLSPTVPEPPKPKKFFKSRNAAPPEVIAQLIQQLPHVSTSPIRDSSAASCYASSHSGRDPIKMKIPKKNSAERKKKSPKKALKAAVSGDGEGDTDGATDVTIAAKPKKKKEEKKLKPEAPPSRIISRARKTVNYCEDDEDERIPTPLKDIIFPKIKQSTDEKPPDIEPVLPPPAAPIAPAPVSVAPASPAPPPPPPQVAPKTPEHPPIVLRISKGTSRLVSTDSEEQATNSPQHETATKSSEPLKSSRHTSTEDATNSAALPAPLVLPTTPKIILKPPKPPSPTPATAHNFVSQQYDDDPPEINYCTVKISPDKPPKERLKLIIKTDVIRNAIAAAAAAEKAKAAAAAERAAAAALECTEKPEKERKQKNKKHKHLKHAALEQLTPAAAGVEFKTPSPHLALGSSNSHQQVCSDALQAFPRTVISPPAISERDFDSQSSVLGSISSKGNSTPQLLAQTAQEESCVIHSRGSSVITSDLETSQHSSLVAPPSDIESRLESMMEGALDSEDVLDATQKVAPIREEPLQEDILAVLRGDETLTAPEVSAPPVNGEAENEQSAAAVDETLKETEPARRVTRGRRAGAPKNSYIDEDSPPKVQPATRTRGRKIVPYIEESPLPKRSTRGRGATNKKSEEPATAMEVDAESPSKATSSAEEITPTKSEKQTECSPTKSTAVITTPVRRGRPRSNNNNLNNNNNIINKIVADLSAKAGAAEEAAKVTTSPEIAADHVGATNARSYGRKRKNQQVTQVLQPSIAEVEHTPTPAKLANIDDTTRPATTPSIDLPSHEMQENNSTLSNQTPTMDFESNSESNIIASNTENSNAEANTSPPPRDYRIKDKFKRTLMLDHQAAHAVNSNAAGIGGTSPNTHSLTPTAPIEETEQRAAVKLVITKKKGSIFKSRALVPDQAEQAAAKRSHLYKHRWDAEANGGSVNTDGTPFTESSKTDGGAKVPTRTAVDAIYDDFSEDLSGGATSRDNSPSLAKLTRITKPNPQANPYDVNSDLGVTDSITSVKVDRKAKEYYTVVRNVKTAHQIQEIGEYQEMDDDVEYILDALQPHNPTPTRCLSALQLATKCMTPAFRMHVRAHGVVTKFFKALSDANTDLSLGLCTTAIMYILSQEGLNMDLDRDSLELMMNLLEAEGVAAAPSDHANFERNKQKVRELCEDIKAQGKATHLNVDTITVGTLAMETLLSLTSKRAGEWFKEELRELGGLEHIIKTISDCSRPVIDGSTSPLNWTQSLLDNMKTVERCMRVMENVTQMNEENQKYMLTYARGSAVSTLCDLYHLCDRELMLYPTTDFTSKDNPGIVIRELLIPLIKVLINLTHTFNPTNPFGADTLGKRADLIETSFHILLQVPNYIPDRCVFELNILVLLLLINLTMYTATNRMLIMKAYAPPEFGAHYHGEQIKITAIEAVMTYFYKCEELARLVEKNTDAILDCSDKNKKKQEEVDETVNNLLQKAGHHMEHTMKGSYAGILIGHLITDSKDNEAIIRTHLRGNGFKEIVSVLEKYYTFMNLTASSEASVVAHIKSTKKLIDYFKKRDLVNEMNDTSNDCALPLNSASTTVKRSSPQLSPTPATRNTTQRVYKTYSQR